MIKEKIMLDMLTTESVSLVRQKYFIEEGVGEYPIGEKWRRAYYNDEKSIEVMKEEIEQPYLSVILQMWGVGQ